MRAIIKVLTSHALLLSVAFVMLALVLWWGGPYLALGEARPFETLEQRLLSIAWLAVLFILSGVLGRFRVRRASHQLAQQLSVQSVPVEQSTAEAAQLRARFTDAIAALRAARGKAFDLYQLPWYLIIGPPGVGKTTVIANSGLSFPLAQQFGSRALRGVGGTRNCDWWFTDEAVLLDTAGRYTTQDSDAAADQGAWTEFLRLLCKHRGRRPINGVLVAMSAPELLSQSAAERDLHVQAVQARLAELERELAISVPVYLLLTKLDLISGFTEFFDDFNQEQRNQVWGVTFTLQTSRAAEGPGQLATEFDLLLERLNARVMLRMDSERDVRRRALLFTFPRQFAALRRNLSEFVTAVFSGDAAARELQLRGVYFTSGTQEGTPIDRMIGALARTFGINVRHLGTQPSQGRAYFIQRLLKDVLFKEAGLAGVNQRMEQRRRAWNLGIYAAVVVMLVTGLIGLSVSYRSNASYLASLTPPIRQLETLRRELNQNTPLVAGLARLDAFAKAAVAAEQYRGDVPLSMRWGLYQGRSLGNAARDAYQAELNAVLLPAIADHFRDQLLALSDQPDSLYEYLKAYLALGEPQRRDPNLLLYIGNLEWRRVFAEDAALLERFNAHFNALIADAEHMQPARMDMQAVARARNSLAQVSVPALLYGRLKLGYVNDQRIVNLALEMPPGAEAVFVRNSGAQLRDALPALYTRAVFAEVANYGKAELVAEFARDSWVLGSDVAPAAAPLLGAQLMQLYEADYIRAWEQLLGDLRLDNVVDAQLAARHWGVLGAASSPLKRLLEVARIHTLLVEPETAPAVSGTLRGAGDRPSGPARAGDAITKHFRTLHQLLVGEPPAIDATLERCAAIQRAIETLVKDGTTPLRSTPELASLFKELQLHSKTLPPSIARLFERVGAESFASPQLRGDLRAKPQQR